ncbi:DUF4262 domain-containing protein [uncultured Phenylobacterium sp.]|uniref:DUF4262 domain-containing protein n=1 Tax=uncultured Phenylobacterium sp. TaxID=349273 RepID=UPI0025DCD794|nr:DUF4262 domain-containing protein [uncultured Phenylobacterium sp.]
MLERLRRAWHERGIDRRVAKRGWTAIYVGDYRSAPTWVYTVGFDETLGQPEIVLFDATQMDANTLLWMAHEALRTGSLELRDGEAWALEDEVFGVWREVHASQIDTEDAWLGAAVNRRQRRTGRRDGLRAFQLVIPDDAHRYPWEDGYNEHLRHRQAALYLPAEDYGDVPLSPGDREALRVTRERGWALRLIDAPLLKWAYSIGLADAGRPELIAFLLSADAAANMLHEAQDHIARGDLVLEDGLRWNGLGFECCWRRVHESQYRALNVFFLTKLWHERRRGRCEAVAAYQLFLPDRNGRYPWEPECHKANRDSQPLLFQPFVPEQMRRGPLAALMRM